MRLQTLLVCAALLGAIASAHAQVHQAHAGDYVLRSNVTRSTAIDESTARAHGIDPAPRRALLDVVVLRQSVGTQQPVAADVHVRAVTLAGMQREIAMHAARAPNGDVSYVGTFDFASREVLDFRVRAVPNAAEGQPLTLEFRERMPAH